MKGMESDEQERLRREARQKKELAALKKEQERMALQLEKEREELKRKELEKKDKERKRKEEDNQATVNKKEQKGDFRISNFNKEEERREDSCGSVSMMGSKLNQYSIEREQSARRRQNDENVSHAGSGCPCDWSLSRDGKKKRKTQTTAKKRRGNKLDKSTEHKVFQDKSQILDMLRNQTELTEEELRRQRIFRNQTQEEFEKWQQRFRPLENNNELMLQLYLQNKQKKLPMKGLTKDQKQELSRLKELDRHGMLNNGKFGTKTWRMQQRSLSPLNPKRNLSKRSTHQLAQFQLQNQNLKEFERLKPKVKLDNLATNELLSFYGDLKGKVNKDQTKMMRHYNEETSKSFILKGNY